MKNFIKGTARVFYVTIKSLPLICLGALIMYSGGVTILFIKPVILDIAKDHGYDISDRTAMDRRFADAAAIPMIDTPDTLGCEDGKCGR